MTGLRCAIRPSPLSGSAAVRAWYAQLAIASETPGLVQHLVRHWGELLPRFLAWHRRLRSLPRRIRRALERCRGLSYASLALMLALCAGEGRSATIHVDETTCSLGTAIAAANSDVAAGGCDAGSGADTIVLDADVTLGPDRLLPEVTSTISIVSGSGSVIDGNGGPCLVVDGNLTLEGLTVRSCVGAKGGAVYNEGTVTIRHCTISGNLATDFNGGGGVQSFFSTLVVEDSVVSDNTATRDGGGLRNVGGYLSVTRSTISGNTATFQGGGVDTYSGTTIVIDSVVSGNRASGGGGLSSGLVDFGAVLSVTGSTISGNTATTGGGIYGYEYGQIFLTRSTVSGNTASSGGGIGISPSSRDLQIHLTSTTVTGNTATSEGGGVDVSRTNLPAALVLSRSLISGNAAPSGSEIFLEAGTVTTADDFNVVGVDGSSGSTGFTPGPTDIVPASGVLIDDVLAPLADNGGPTPTHALVPASPAVDAIPTTSGGCTGTVDQRGQPRPVGAGCDSGSFELVVPPSLGGSLTGAIVRRAECRNQTTGQLVRGKASEPGWDCGALGLAVQPGDSARTDALGVADGSAPFGGSVTGMTPASVTCQNLASGAEVRAATSARTWDCEAMGLAVAPGDRVKTGAQGTID
jgi:hypothetical protein